MRSGLAFYSFVLVGFVLCGAAANDEPLTAERVVEIASTRAPEVRIAHTRVQEARGRLQGSRAWALENPTVEGLRGSNDMVESTELDLTVPLGLGPRRRSRVKEASADVDREIHLEADSRRLTIAAALRAYYNVLHSEQRLAIAQDRSRLAEELVRVSHDRLEAGDVSRLDVIVSESEASRAASEVLAEEGNIAGARQELARALGFSSGAALDIEGDLADRSVLETHVDSTAPEDRADVLAAKSEVASASAAVSSARAEWVPELAFRMDYERTDNEELLRPGIELSLPLFNRGQGARGEAKARHERALIQLESQRAAALAEVEGTRSSYRSAVASTREIQTDALPRALEIESLVTEAYAAGKIDLPSLILVRSNALDTRREHADRLFEAALRGIDFAMAAGAFR